ncbi:restriction endonuclease [Cryomorpha ignava]|uniref:Restriction endonuclease n=1 Tax=Cryomorpha ignava TaxID=101383 RepID=A0A7K3WXJ7_9FLAO|nr:restriction endonuclease [Cryomorpha ignava]NEN25355.1 restriction endonuclease [Cryomorpha ignava]
MNKVIQVFEHQTLYYGRDYNGVPFTQKQFDALAELNLLHDNKYFTLVHKGIKFSQYVGVVQIDTLTIEVLPKADQLSDNTTVWRNVLIQMLRSTRKLKVNQVGQAHVSKQNIHLLDIYFDWFLREVETLIRQGLIKKYYKETKNVAALKGKLEFAGHISKNLIHKERFYTTHQIYDKDHQVHQILNQALQIIEQLSKGSYIYPKCKSVQLDFPEVSEIRCNAATFDKLKLNRKSMPYEKALEIARLIILNYAPNISSGSERMLALLFDMNSLWEEYILIQLQKAAVNKTYQVTGQQSKSFWGSMTLRPDIVISQNDETKIIIDTKWKQIEQNKPAIHDLRQMYVYNDHWKSTISILLYPGSGNHNAYYQKFHFPDHSCGILKISVLDTDGNLDKRIGEKLLEVLVAARL